MADNLGSGSTPVVSENESSNEENSNTNNESNNIDLVPMDKLIEGKQYYITYGNSKITAKFIGSNFQSLIFKEKSGSEHHLPKRMRDRKIKLSNAQKQLNTQKQYMKAGPWLYTLPKNMLPNIKGFLGIGGKRKTKKTHRKRKARITRRK